MDRVASLPTRADARASLGLGDDDRVLALFPGSRRQEVALHLDAFVAVAKELERRMPGLKPIVAVAPHVTVDPARCPYPMVKSASFTVLRAADAALCKSGTTTLEAAVAGCPLVVTYRLNPLNYVVAKWLIKVSNISLVNLIAERRLVPEFVQDELEPRAVADALAPLLDRSSAARREMIRGLDDVRASLGQPGAASRVAEMVLDVARRGDRAR
jgi:lipid-A-disaccharide synthase